MVAVSLKSIRVVATFAIALALVGLLLFSSYGGAYAQEPETSTPTEISTETVTLEPSATPTLLSDTPTIEFSPSPTETLIGETPTATIDLSLTPTLSETPTTTATETPSETPTATATIDCTVIAAEYADLCAAAAEGSLRVIVELDVNVRPVSQISDQQEAAQEERIEDSQEIVAEQLEDNDAEIVREFESIPFIAVEINDQEALIELVTSEEVEDLQLDEVLAPSLEYSVPLIGADDTWNLGFTGEGQTVAILDTGVDYFHNFLLGKLVYEACYSTDGYRIGSYTTETLCPNGQDTQEGTWAGYACSNSLDGCDHGTHVAGIAVGEMPGHSGVAPDADFMSIQVFSRFPEEMGLCGSDPADYGGDCVLALTSDVLYGLQRVYDERNNFDIAAVNLSLGSGLYTSNCDAIYPAVKALIDNLRAVGIATVAAAGNDGYSAGISFPACISSAISVGASTDGDLRASFSNWSAQLSLVAPGVGINSSEAWGTFVSWSGTSMAAPHVAGAWALIQDLDANLAVTDVLNALKNTGTLVSGKPRINVDAALISLSPKPATPSLISPANNSYVTTRTPTMLWSLVPSASFYELQISEDTTFLPTVSSSYVLPGASPTYTTTDYSEGRYYWRVRSLNQYGRPGDWSALYIVYVDTIAPLAPALSLPADNLINSRVTPLHRWVAPATATGYQLQYDEDLGDFSTPVFDSGTITAVQVTPAFAQLGNFDWRVRARDLAGNWSPWSAVRSLQIIAPLTIAPVQVGPIASFLTNNNAPDFTWNAVPWAATYQLQIDNQATFASPEQDMVDTLGLTSHTASALPDGVWYWRVRAWNVNSPSEPGAWSAGRMFTVDTTAPLAPAPSKPLASNVENTRTPKFEWLAAPTANMYWLEVDNDSDFSSPLVQQQTSVLTYTLSAAQALDFVPHYWRVQARDAAGNWGAWSQTRSFTLSTMTAPLQGAFVTDETPILRWTAVAGAISYNYIVADDPGFTMLFDQNNTTGLSTAVWDLSLGLYYWKIQAVTASGPLEWMPVQTFTVTTAPPGIPPLVSPNIGLLTSDNTPDLSWGAGLNAATYQIQIASNSSFAAIVESASSGVTSYTSAGLPDGTLYWRVRSLNLQGSPGAWSVTRNIVVDTTAPAAPNLSAPANGFSARVNSPALQWTASPGANAYMLQVDQLGDSFASPIYQSAWVAALANTPPVNSLPLGNYEWRVIARDAAMNVGVASAPRALNIIANLPAVPVQTAPVSGFLTANTTPSFTWNPAVGAATYDIQLDNNSNFSSPEETTSGLMVTNFTSPSLADGVWYWRVRAINVNPEAGAWTAARMFTIDTTAPAAPNLSAPVNSFSARINAPLLSWTAAAGATTYQVQIDETGEDFSLPYYQSGWLTTVSHMPPPLLNLGTYNWRVLSRDAALNVSAPSAVRELKLIAGLPAVPVQNIPPLNATLPASMPIFAWNAAPNGVTYDIQIDNNSNFASPEESQAGLANLVHVSAGLTDGVWYWRIRANNVNVPMETSAWSAARMFTVDTTAPAVPTMTSPGATVVGAPTFVWTRPLTATHFQLQIDENDGDFTTPLYDSGVASPLTVLSFKPPAAVFPGDVGEYEWRVRARDAFGNWSEWTLPNNLLIAPPTPVAPMQTNPANGFITNNSAPALSFGNVQYGATYEVQTASNAAFTVNVNNFDLTSGGNLPWSVSDGTYYWRVRALNSYGVFGAYSASRTFVVDTSAPLAPNLTVPAAAFNARVNLPMLQWAASVGANNYRVQIDAAGADFSAPLYQSAWIATVTHMPPANALPLGNYEWRVLARDAAMNISATSAVRPLNIIAALPAAPVQTAPAASLLTADSTPSFTWNAALNGVTYDIQIDNNSNFSSPEESSLAMGGLTYTSLGLGDGLWYWRVRANNVNPEPGAWSATRAFTVDTTAPLAPLMTTPANLANARVSSPSLMWAAAIGAASYQVQIDEVGGDFSTPLYQSAWIGTLSHIPPANALPLGSYDWRVLARDAAFNVSVPGVGRTLNLIAALPAVPMQTAPVAGALTGDNTPTFAWNAAQGGNTYDIQIDNNSNFASPEESSLAIASLNFTSAGLGDGIWYWRVRANNVNTPAEAGAWSAMRALTVDTSAPPSPNLTAPANAFNARVNAPALQWAAAVGANAYQVQIDESGGDFSSPVYQSAWLAAVAHTPPVNSLPLGSYDWRVLARDAALNVSAASAVRVLNIIANLPAVPVQTAPAANFLTNNNAPTFTWNAAAGGGTYEIQIDNNSNFASPEASASSIVPPLSHTPSSLADGAWYWRVRALNANPVAEPGAWSAARMLTVDTTPPQAPNMSLPADNATVVGTPTFTWAASAGATQYEFQLDEDGQDFSSPVAASPSQAAMSFKPNPFSSLGNFDWRVRARDAAGNWGAWSTVRSVLINPPLPGVPTLIGIANNAVTSDNTPTLNWNPVSYGDYYEIWIDLQSNFALPRDRVYIGVDGENNLSYTETNPLPDGRYYWWVWGYNTLDQHSPAWSAIWNFTVDTIAPAAPTLSQPLGGTSSRGSAPLHTWVPVAGAVNYKIEYDEVGGDFSTPIFETGWLAMTSFKPSYSMLGDFDWRVLARDAALNVGPASLVRTHSIVYPLTLGPVLSSPAVNALTNDNTPSFAWQSSTWALNYQIQVSQSANFAAPIINVDGINGLAYNAGLIPDGPYYWRVRAWNDNAVSEAGAWSAIRMFTIGNYP
jgi:subtilisin family serine protease